MVEQNEERDLSVEVTELQQRLVQLEQFVAGLAPLKTHAHLGDRVVYY